MSSPSPYDGETEADGDFDGELEADGDTDDDGDTDGEPEALGDFDAEADGETLTPGTPTAVQVGLAFVPVFVYC